MMKKNPFRVYERQIEACVSEPPSVRDRRRRREVRLKQHRKKLGERECVCVIVCVCLQAYVTSPLCTTTCEGDSL